MLFYCFCVDQIIWLRFLHYRLVVSIMLIESHKLSFKVISVALYLIWFGTFFNTISEYILSYSKFCDHKVVWILYLNSFCSNLISFVVTLVLEKLIKPPTNWEIFLSINTMLFIVYQRIYVLPNRKEVLLVEWNNPLTLDRLYYFTNLLGKYGWQTKRYLSYIFI